MTALSATVVRRQALPMAVRLGIVGAMAAAITAYFWLPFMLYKAYLMVGLYMPRSKFDSFGAGQIITWLIGGDLFDYGRIPLITVMVEIGVVYAVITRGGPARFALAMFAVWMLLYFGRPTWGGLVDLMPLHEGLMIHRFIGGVDFAAILFVGLAGEWLWRLCGSIRGPWRAVVPGTLTLALMFPALRERRDYYSDSTAWMQQTKRALDTDPDWQTMIAAVRQQPPGRVYAGLKENWGYKLQFGYIHFYDMLAFYRIPAVSPPCQDLSLNAELVVHFDDRNPAHYDVFNARYVIAPTGLEMPPFLAPIKHTPRYTLYRAATSGYGEFVAIAAWITVGSQASLFEQNKNWLASSGPQARRYIRWNFALGSKAPDAPPSFGDPTTGVVTDERIRPETMEFMVNCTKPSTFVIKMTYHPKWRIKIDGKEQPTFMVSPSYIGVAVPSGRHHVLAEYTSGWLKNGLLLLAACTLVVAVVFRNRFSRIERRIFSILKIDGAPTT